MDTICGENCLWMHGRRSERTLDQSGWARYVPVIDDCMHRSACHCQALFVTHTSISLAVVALLSSSLWDPIFWGIVTKRKESLALALRESPQKSLQSFLLVVFWSSHRAEPESSRVREDTPSSERHSDSVCAARQHLTAASAAPPLALLCRLTCGAGTGVKEIYLSLAAHLYYFNVFQNACTFL